MGPGGVGPGRKTAGVDGPGEALALDRDDVDLRHRVVLVRTGKQHKQREVPLHDTTVTGIRFSGRPAPAG